MTKPRGIHRRTAIELTPDLIARFWRRVDKRDANSCWPWQGALRNGYGAIKHQDQVLGTHVVSYVIHNGPVPKGLIITHSCDNRLCVNPRHLSAATFADNARDMQERRRISAPRGEELPNAVLTEDTVRQILKLRSKHGYGATRISRLLGVSVSAVEGVLQRRTWRHVSP